MSNFVTTHELLQKYALNKQGDDFNVRPISLKGSTHVGRSSLMHKPIDTVLTESEWNLINSQELQQKRQKLNDLLVQSNYYILLNRIYQSIQEKVAILFTNETSTFFQSMVESYKNQIDEILRNDLLSNHELEKNSKNLLTEIKKIFKLQGLNFNYESITDEEIMGFLFSKSKDETIFMENPILQRRIKSVQKVYDSLAIDILSKHPSQSESILRGLKQKIFLLPKKLSIITDADIKDNGVSNYDEDLYEISTILSKLMIPDILEHKETGPILIDCRNRILICLKNLKYYVKKEPEPEPEPEPENLPPEPEPRPRQTCKSVKGQDGEIGMRCLEIQDKGTMYYLNLADPYDRAIYNENKQGEFLRIAKLKIDNPTEYQNLRETYLKNNYTTETYRVLRELYGDYISRNIKQISFIDWIIEKYDNKPLHNNASIKTPKDFMRVVYHTTEDGGWKKALKDLGYDSDTLQQPKWSKNEIKAIKSSPPKTDMTENNKISYMKRYGNRDQEYQDPEQLEIVRRSLTDFSHEDEIPEPTEKGGKSRRRRHRKTVNKKKRRTRRR